MTVTGSPQPCTARVSTSQGLINYSLDSLVRLTIASCTVYVMIVYLVGLGRGAQAHLLGLVRQNSDQYGLRCDVAGLRPNGHGFQVQKGRGLRGITSDLPFK
jgi:hypothetical protein